MKYFLNDSWLILTAFPLTVGSGSFFFPSRIRIISSIVRLQNSSAESLRSFAFFISTGKSSITSAILFCVCSFRNDISTALRTASVLSSTYFFRSSRSTFTLRSLTTEALLRPYSAPTSRLESNPFSLFDSIGRKVKPSVPSRVCISLIISFLLPWENMASCLSATTAACSLIFRLSKPRWIKLDSTTYISASSGVRPSLIIAGTEGRPAAFEAFHLLCPISIS